MSAARQCPSCQHAMDAVQTGRVTVDRCARCHAVFFDPGELDEVLGTRALLAKNGDRSAHRCASCRAAMVRLLLMEQPVYRCVTCKGVFVQFTALQALRKKAAQPDALKRLQ